MTRPAPPDPSPDREGYAVSRRHAWLAFGILYLLMLFDYLDRSIVASMFPYIKRDWALTDTQLGSLASIVPLMVGVLGIPVALLVDRWSRVKSIVLMGVLWSLATVGCMFAGGYAQLLALRALVGVGEAGYGPAGSVLLAHHFPARMRCTVIGGFVTACSLGVIVGIVAGGVLAARWGWQAAFGIVGVPGLILALAAFAIRDFATVPLAARGRDPGPFRTELDPIRLVRELFRARSVLPICLASGLATITMMALGTWLPSFFERHYGLDGAAAGIKSAPVVIAVACGTLLWSMVADRLALRAARLRLVVTGLCCLGTPAILFPAFLWMEPGAGQFATIVLGGLVMGGCAGIPIAAMMDVTHPGLRSTACSFVATVANGIGIAAGPIIVGFISDRIGLAPALAMVTLCSLPAAALHARAARHYDADARLASGTVLPLDRGNTMQTA